MDSSGDEEVQVTEKPRKRRKSPKDWAKNVAKQRRNSGQGK